MRLPAKVAAWALAAAVVLAGAALATYVVVNTRPQTEDLRSRGLPVATLIDATTTVLVDNDIAHPGTDYHRGTYSINTGRAEFLLTNRVGVVLQGRSSLTMHSNMAATLTQGSASFNCPPAAKGFTVRLPGGAKVIDLGTAFAVRVNRVGDSAVFVTEGAVMIETDGGQFETVKAGHGCHIGTDLSLSALGDEQAIEAFGQAVLAQDDVERELINSEPVAYLPLMRKELGGWQDMMANEPFSAVGVTFDADSGAAVFDGAGGIELGERSDLMIDAPMTLEMKVWLEPGATQRQRLISVDGGTASALVGWGVAVEPVEGGYQPLFTHYRVNDYRIGEVVLPAGRWVHLAYVVDVNTVTLFVEGEFRGATVREGAMRTGSVYACVGKLAKNTEHLHGRIAWVAVHNRIVESGEIKNHLMLGDQP